MEALVTWLMTYDWWIYVASFVAIASAVAAFMPSTVKESAGWNIFMKLVNLIALNIAKAKSADDKTEIKVVPK